MMSPVSSTQPAFHFPFAQLDLSQTGPSRYTPSAADYVTRFNESLKRWRAETMWLSTVQEMIDLPSFRSIVSVGPAAIPMIIRELSVQPDFLFVALHLITGDDPLRDSSRGKIIDSVEDWLRWAERNGVARYAT